MKRLLFFLIVSLLTTSIYAQQFIVSFKAKSLKSIPSFVSIDYVSGDSVIGYLWGRENYEKFLLLFPNAKLLSNYKKSKYIVMAQSIDEMSNWDRYPTYQTYLEMMQTYVQNYPQICKLDTIGYSQEGRLLLSMVISDNPEDMTEFEPRFFYTSTMHGDEVAGYVVLLRLIDYLLKNYNRDSLVTFLVNNFRIYINPLANPDGTYYGSNNNISGAIRYYQNFVDPNRNFAPLPDGISPSDPTECIETEALKTYASQNRFIMAMNIHGGAEVFNYPWDVYTSSENVHADDAWYREIGERFVQTAREQDAYYMTDITSTGVTEGGDWYVIYGSRQDYMNFVQHCKEVTYEISSSKTPSSDQLPYFWNVSYRSLLNYILEARKGLAGVILDNSGEPLNVLVRLEGYDKDSSEVRTHIESGVYFRPLLPGNYQLSFYNEGNVLMTENVDVNQGINIVNYIPNIQNHNVEFLAIDEQGDTLSNIPLKIYDVSGNQINELTLNGLEEYTLNTGIYKLNIKIDAINYNQYFYEAITKNRVIKFILPQNDNNTATILYNNKLIKVYPNPAQTWIKIEGEDLEKLVIYDFLGRISYKASLNNISNLINISMLKTGLYVLEISSVKGEKVFKKLLVQ